MAQQDMFSENVPFAGEIPPGRMSEGSQFWLNVNMSRVPESFIPEEVPLSVRDDLPRLFASFRSTTGLGIGSRNSRKLRLKHLTPAHLYSLPHMQEGLQLVLAEKQLHSHTDALGVLFLNQLTLLHIIPPEELDIFNRNEFDVRELLEKDWRPTIMHTFQVLPRRMHVHKVETSRVLGVTFMNCPSTRIVHCDVPVVPVNEEESPSAKKGGYALVTKKKVKIRSLAINIPDSIEVDCSSFETGHKVFLRDVDLGQGRHLVGTSEEECIIVMETSG